MVEREAQRPGRPAADRGRDLQPPARRHAARNRRDDLLRGRARATRPRLPARTHRGAAADRTRRTTRASTRACRRRRSRTRGSPRSKPRRTPRTWPTSTTWPAPTAAASRCSRPATPHSKPTPPPTTRRGENGGQPPVPASASDDAARRPRLAGRAQPLAGDAQRRARALRDERLALPAAARAAARCSTRPSRALGTVRASSGRQRHDPAQAGGARARRPAPARPRARSAPRTRSRSPPTGRSRPRTPTRPA